MTTLATTTRREPLSRERVLREAIAIADEGGIDALTMRRLAQQLEAAEDLVVLRQGRDDADGLVQHHAQHGVQNRLSVVVQDQGLAGLDLAARVIDALAVDEDQALADQGLRLAA